MSVVQTLIGNVKGPQGIQGPTGATGATGSAATITVGSTTTTAYGNAASVTNSGTSSAAVLDFVIPQGRPGQATTTMGDLVLDSITTSLADFPTPALNDTGATAFGKIIKFFSDTLARFTKHAGDIATVSPTTTTQNFSAGDFLVNNDQLYKVTSNISSGGTITPGTNVTSTSVGAQLTSLNDSLTYTDSGTATSSITGGTIADNSWFRKGNVVNLVFRQHSISATANGNVATVPAAARPSAARYINCVIYVNNTAFPVIGAVNSNGILSFGYSTGQTMTQVAFYGTYFI